MNNQFLKDVVDGLSQKDKAVSSKYFYDKKGDDLFIQIMAMDEYYLTDSEMEIFEHKTSALVDMLELEKENPFELVELGAGDGTKTVKLLNHLLETDYSFAYLPIDISKNSLDNLSTKLGKELPELQVTTQQGEYFTVLDRLKATPKPRVILFLGSNLGNFLDKQANDYLKRLSDAMLQGDKLVLGLDLIKDPALIKAAYDDREGITAAFNLNLLDRINQELDGNFDVDQFEHYPYYDVETGVAKSYIRSKIAQSVHIGAANKTVVFEAGELIWTEISRKYDRAILENVLEGAGLEIKGSIKDSRGYFADFVLEKV